MTGGCNSPSRSPVLGANPADTPPLASPAPADLLSSVLERSAAELIGSPTALAEQRKTEPHALVGSTGGEAIRTWPIDVLVAPDGWPFTKVEDVGTDEVRTFLRAGGESIAIINLGDSVRWCHGADALNAWTAEIRDHLIEPDRPRFLDDFPGRYFYTASRWSSADGTADTVVCFKNH